MDAMEAILTRRSVRTYKIKKISDEIINELTFSKREIPIL